MGGESRCTRRRRRIAGTCRGAVDSQSPTSILDFADDLLDHILLRVETPVSLICAAATCKLWRRVIAGDGFLRRFHRLNGPHILGHYYYWECLRPAFVPLAVPAAGKPAIDTSDRVSLHFLPNKYSCPARPVLQDSRGGLLAFRRLGFNVIVCSPWTRQHREIYTSSCSSCMPGVGKGTVQFQCLGVFLLDADPSETEASTSFNMSTFRVIYVHLLHYRNDDIKAVQACVFSARDNSWVSLSPKVIGDIIPGLNVYPEPFRFVGRAGGSICWSTDGQCSNVVLHLNESTGEFSYLRLPGQAGINKNSLDYYRGNLSVIGTMHLVRIVGNDLEVLRYAHINGRACVVDRRIIFSRQMASSIDCRPNARQARSWYFSHTAHEAASPGCTVLCDNECGVEYIWRFSVDTQNMKQRCMHKLNRSASWVFPYELPWPPTISACLCDDATQEESDNNP